MQRVVRSTLVGLLTIAGLAACGDKVTVPGITTTPPDNTVKQVTVSPTNITLPVGSTLTVGASVDAGAGVTDRTVTWSSADATIATVGATDGVVKGIKAGVTSVTAKSKADPTQSASVAVTVTPLVNNTATVSISAINQTVCVVGGACNSVPANVQNFGTATGGTGQLDVVVNVEPNGAALKTLGGALTCGTKTLNAATQNLSSAASATDAEANASLITLSFNTVEYDPANGTPRVFNTGPFNVKAPNTVAPCSLQVTLTPVTGAAINAGSRTVELNNNDAVILTTVNENGAQAADLNGVPWKSGDVKVSVLPVLYSERGAQSLSVTLTGANPALQTVTTTTAGTVDFKWLNNSNADFRVDQRTVFGGIVNGVAVPTAPTVTIIDSRGNNVPLVPPVTVPASQYSIALDNQSPQPPLTFQIVQGQGQWVNAFYTFFQVVTGTAPSTANMKYVSCGDPAASIPSVGASWACQNQGGVSAATPSLFSNANGVNRSANGQAGPVGGPALRVFAFDVSGGASIPGTAMPATGTSTSSNVCGGLTAAGSPWVDVTANPAALIEGPVNTRYAIRAIETDRLGNSRCTDLATLPNAINTDNSVPANTFARAFIGVDKTKPTVPNERLQNSNENIAAVDQNGTIKAAQAVTNFIFAASDNLSGFGAAPVLSRLRRRDAQNTGTGVCVLTLASGCPFVARPIQGVPVDSDSLNVSSGIDGIYTYEAIVGDLAANRDTLPSRTAMIDRVVPIMGGIQVQALIQGGTSVSFPTNATDNLDLLRSNFSLQYPITAAGGGAPLVLRADGPTFGAAFDATFETNRSFSYTVSSFVRSIATTTAAGLPQNNAVLPNQIGGRAIDAVGNVSAVSNATIGAANIPIPFPGATNNGPTDWLAPIPGNVAATFNAFVFSAPAAAVNISNCSATLGCTPISTPPVAPANASTVTLTVQASGSESGVAPAFQFPNPFPAGVSFYYQDAASTEWVLIATVTGATVSDNATATIRTFSWSLQWDPAESIVVGNTPVVAVGVNAKGDALASPVNTNITLTNP